jgi:hypothetical protein
VPSFDQFRRAFPELAEASDEEILKDVSSTTGMPIQDVAARFGYSPSKGGKNAQRFSASIDNWQAGLYGVGEALAGKAGIGDWFRRGRENNEVAAEVASGRAQQMGAVDRFSDVHGVADFGDYAAGLAIQSAPYLAEAATGGIGAGRVAVRAGISRAALPTARTAGAVGAGYPSAVGDVLQNQRDQNGTTDLLSAGVYGAGYAGLNALGVEGALARGHLFRNTVGALDNMTGVSGAAARTAATAGRTAAVESASETGQEAFNQLGRMAVDPTETFYNERSAERFKESAIGGAVLGGITGGAAGGWRRSENRPSSLLPEANVTEDYSYRTQQTPTTPPAAPAPMEPPVGPSVNINPAAAQQQSMPPVANTQPESKGKQPTDAPVSDEERKVVAETYRAEPVIDNGTEEGHWRFLGKDYFNRTELNKAIDKEAVADRGTDPGVVAFRKTLNTEGTPFMRSNQLRELAGSLYSADPKKLAYNLDAAIAGGHKEADRLAAAYEKITGEESPAWKKSQEPAEKKPAATAAKAAPAKAAVAATKNEVKPSPVPDSPEGMARAILMKLYNNNELNADIALADIAGEKPEKIAEDFGVSGSLVRKLRQRRAPKALELAARQAGVDIEALREVLAGKTAVEEATTETMVEEEGRKEITDSDERTLAVKSDEELTEEQKESDAFATGMSVREGSATQIADASAKNNSRSKLEKAGNNLLSKSLTAADLNNLYVEAVEAGDDVFAKKVEDAALARYRRGDFKHDPELENDEREEVPAGQGAGAAKGAAAKPAARAEAKSKKEPKGEVGTAWDKMVRQVAKAKVEMPAWESLTPEQRIKAQDKYVLNDKKFTLIQAQEVVRSKAAAESVAAKKPATPAPTAAPAMDTKSAETVSRVRKSAVATKKEPTGSDFMAKLNAAAAAKKAAAEKPNADNMYVGETKKGDQNLKVAQVMLDNGESAEKIRLATGWFKGPHDGKWRREISDANASLKKEAWDAVPESKLFEQATTVPLTDVLDHQKLFKAYPELKNLRVVKRKGFLDFGGLQGWFDGDKTIGITPYSKDPLSTLLHEIQHWIQHREGYAQGGNADAVFEQLTETQKKRAAAKVIRRLKEEQVQHQERLDELKLAMQYAAMPEVSAARDAQEASTAAFTALQQYDKEGGPSGPLRDLHHNAWMEAGAAKRQADQALFSALGAKKWSELSETQQNAVVKAKIFTQEMLEKDVVSTSTKLVEGQQLLSQLESGDLAGLKKALEKTGETYDLYKKIAGEIEARDTQARQKLTDDERRAKEPFSSEKVDPEDVIVHFGTGKANSTGEGAPKGWGRIEADEQAAPAFTVREYGEAAVRDFGDGPLPVTNVVDVVGFFEAHANTRAVANLLIEQDIDNILDGLDQVFVVEAQHMGARSAQTGPKGSYFTWPSGHKALGISASQLQDDNPHGAFVLLHELGHAADLVGTFDKEHLGQFSRRFDLQFGVMKNGERIPIGPVAQELHKLWRTNEHWAFLRYPLDPTVHAKLTKFQVHREIFAQLFSAYMLYPERVSRDAPLAFAFMERVVNDIRTENFAKALRRSKLHAERQASGDVVRPPGRDTRSEQFSDAIEGDATPADGFGQEDRQAGRSGREGNRQARQGRAAEKLISALPAASQSGARKLWTNIKDAAKKGLYGIAFTQDLADLASKTMPTVRKYMDLMGKKAAVKNELEVQVEGILRQYENLPAKDRLGREQRGTGEHSVNKFVYDSTLNGKWGYKDDPASGIKVDPVMEERFNNLSPEAQTLVRAIFKHGADTLRMKQKIVKDEINDEFRRRIAEAEHEPAKVTELQKERKAKLDEFDSILFIHGNNPYAPLKRFGNYVSIGRSQQYMDAVGNDDKKAIKKLERDPDHYFVSFHETLGEAEEASNRMAATGKYAETSHFEKEKGIRAIYGGPEMFTAFHRMRHIIKSDLANDPADKATQALSSLVSDLYLRSLAETSARKAEISRRGVAGADMDMMKAFATQGRADAHFIAALKHNEEVTDAIFEMRKEAHGAGDDKADRMRLFNEFMQRHASHMEYKETRVQDAILRATSLWFLATSPAYYLQNATQAYMISMPYMAGKHGYGRAMASLTKAYSDLGPMLEGVNWSDRMDFTKAPKDVQRMLQDLIAAGRIDVALDQDLGKFESQSDNKLGTAWNQTDRKLRGMQQKVEAINRVSTAVAAYRMELERTRDHGKATDYANKVVRITHGDYSAFNTPRYFTPGQGLPAAKVLTQFRKFQIIQASLIVRLFNNSFTDNEERLLARKALAFTLGHTAAVGGLFGLPAVGTLSWLVAKLFGDEDEPENPELALRRLIGNEDVADLVLKGAPAYFGVDLSGKLGFGNAFSVLPYSNIDKFNRESYEKGLLGLTGPFFGGLAPKFVDGVDLIGRGDWYKGIEQLLPTGFGNAMKAYRFQDEGVTKRNGDTMLTPEEISFATTLLQSMGLQTKQLTDRTFDQKVIGDFDAFYKEKSGRIRDRYARASKNGNAASMADARFEWDDLQESRARNGFPKQPLSQLLRAPAEQAKRERNVVNGTGANRFNRSLAEELDEI